MPRSLGLLLIGLLLGGGVGFFLAAANNVALDGHHHPAAEDAGHGGTIDLPAGPEAPTLDFRDRIARGELAGPDIYTAGTIIEGLPPPELAAVIDTAGRRARRAPAPAAAPPKKASKMSPNPWNPPNGP